MGANDCGVSSILQLGLAARVTFVPDGGVAKPLPEEGSNEANYLITSPYDATIAITAAAQVSDYVFDVTFNHLPLVGAGYTITTAAIETDAGGFCDSPELDTFVGIGQVQTYSAPPDLDFDCTLSMSGEVMNA